MPDLTGFDLDQIAYDLDLTVRTLELAHMEMIEKRCNGDLAIAAVQLVLDRLRLLHEKLDYKPFPEEASKAAA